MYIRRATEKDIKQIFDLYVQEGWAGFSVDWDFDFDDENAFLLVAEENNKIVATAQLNIISSIAYEGRPFGVVNYIVTRRDYRGKGYMHQIFQRIDTICDSKGCTTVFHATTISRKASQSFFESAGYSEVKGFRKEFLR